ncbi:hypothetical protein [Anabaena sp. UHCC 0204]|nr:hypothetical protein [Anabaena sp. UHCC 0204]
MFILQISKAKKPVKPTDIEAIGRKNGYANGFSGIFQILPFIGAFIINRP